jgi:hypothetical protein
MKNKILIVGTTDLGYIEMDLKTIWCIGKKYVDVKITTIVKLFNNIQLLIQIIQKLSLKNLLNYKTSIADNSKLLEGN